MSKKQEIIHHDIFGIRIVEGDTIIGSDGGYSCPNSRLYKGKVVKLTPSSIQIDVIKGQSYATKISKKRIWNPEHTCYVETGEFKIKENE